MRPDRTGVANTPPVGAENGAWVMEPRAAAPAGGAGADGPLPEGDLPAPRLRLPGAAHAQVAGAIGSDHGHRPGPTLSAAGHCLRIPTEAIAY